MRGPAAWQEPLAQAAAGWVGGNGSVSPLASVLRALQDPQPVADPLQAQELAHIHALVRPAGCGPHLRRWMRAAFAAAAGKYACRAGSARSAGVQPPG